MNDDFLKAKLRQRNEAGALRHLKLSGAGVDLCSNDYLGMVRNKLIQVSEEAMHGSTGSRLLSGNYESIQNLENEIAAFHQAPAALLFNSGYDANIGLLATVAQRTDTVIYDELSHASIRDGIRLSLARSYSFRHNDPDDLEKKLQLACGKIFVVTESVFSMDGDVPPLTDMVDLCDHYEAFLIVDEAHATGIIGERGEGLVQQLGLQDKCFARVHTFGKALGCHGAVVLGSETLRQYLINFSRTFIYTTALPPMAVAAVKQSYSLFPDMREERLMLQQLVRTFRESSAAFKLCKSDTPIQGVIIPGNEKVKKAAAHLQALGLDTRSILYPSVRKDEERLRVVLHSFNTADEVNRLITELQSILS